MSNDDSMNNSSNTNCLNDEVAAEESENDHPSTETSFSGFDAVVKKDRQQRKKQFGPNSTKVKKPSNILIDIYGVISSWSFANDLKKYALEQMGKFIKENWNNKLVKNAVARIREQVNIDKKVGFDIPEILVDDASNQEQVIESAIKSIRWQFERKHKTTKLQIDRLCADLWAQSYENGSLKTHAYSDVTDAFNYWRFEEFIKIYSYASGTVEGQRQFLKASVLGDLNRFIANGLNSSGGYKFDSNKFRSVSAALRESRPENLLYITDDPKKAKNAISAGLRALVVNRNQSSTGKYDPKETQDLQVVNSLSDIEFVGDSMQTLDCC